MAHACSAAVDRAVERAAHFALCVALCAGLGCTSEPTTPAPEAIFPAEAPTTWRQVRSCRHSHEHELNYIRVVADDLAHDRYLQWDAPFPVGATLLKLEYSDAACQQLVRYTAMRKLAKGADPARGDWRWQATSPERVVDEDAPIKVCVACHQAHCRDDNGTGFDLTCAEEEF